MIRGESKMKKEITLDIGIQNHRSFIDLLPAKFNLKLFIALFSVALFWGTTYLAIRIGVETIPPLLVTGLRNVIAGLLFLAYLVYSKKLEKMDWPRLRRNMAIAFLLIVLGSALLSFYQEYNANSAAEKLREQVSFKSEVIRDGKPVSISTEEIVPGDVVLLSAGCLIPADGLVFATPVYFGDMSESARVFVDRLRRCEWPQRQNSPLRGKHLLTIAAAGGSGGGAPGAAARVEEILIGTLGMVRVGALAVTRFNADIELHAAHEFGRLMVEMVEGSR
jgi:NAD(P)H-dependent FMN reductase